MSNGNQLQVINRAETPVAISTQSATFDDVWRMANAVAKSSLFGMKTPDQAFALMMLAQAEGLHPMIAARDYDIIQGRPSKKAEAMLRDFQRSGGKVEWHTLTDAKADATFSHPQGGSFRCDWDLARAKKAGLGGKEMWAKYPRQMLRARCVSEGCKTVFPSSTSGMYTPEEVQDFEPQQPSRVEAYRAQVSDIPAAEQRESDAPAQEPATNRAVNDGREAAPHKFEAINGDGEPLGYDTLTDYISGLELAVSLAIDPAAVWESNRPAFNGYVEAYGKAGHIKGLDALNAVARKLDTTSKEPRT